MSIGVFELMPVGTSDHVEIYFSYPLTWFIRKLEPYPCYLFGPFSRRTSRLNINIVFLNRGVSHAHMIRFNPFNVVEYSLPLRRTT